MNAESSHDADACGQCTFVADRDFIVVTPAQRQQAEVTLADKLRSRVGLYDLEDSIVFIGRFTMPGWTGHNAFWLFTCPGCRRQDVDYLHGFDLYLKCHHCGSPVHVLGDRFYEEADTPKPPTDEQIRKEAKRLAELWERR